MDEMLNRAVLIDDRRIELWWTRQMRGAGDVRSFSVTLGGRELDLVHWTPDMPWSHGTLYQKERIRTTISLCEPVDVSRAGDLRVSVTGDVADLWGRSATGLVATPVYEPLYKQFLTSRDGIVVKGSAEVQPLALEIVRDIVDLMLERLPDVAAHLRGIGAVQVAGVKGLGDLRLFQRAVGRAEDVAGDLALPVQFRGAVLDALAEGAPDRGGDGAGVEIGNYELTCDSLPLWGIESKICHSYITS